MQAISGYMKEERDKSSISNLTVLYDEMTTSVDDGRVEAIICLDS